MKSTARVRKQRVHVGAARKAHFPYTPGHYLLHCLVEVTASWGAQRLAWTSTSDVSAARREVWCR